MKDILQKRLDDRGQVGIGTLIVFIAMVLVAAIAAGVLINTAGFLQSKSQQTGQDSSAQVSNRVDIVSVYGNVSGSGHVDLVNFTVMRGSGSDDINLSQATIEWIGPDNATTLVGNNSSMVGNKVVIAPSSNEFAISPIKDTDESRPVLNSQDDRLRLTVPADLLSDDGNGLSEGQTAQVKITTQYGATTVYQVSIPQSLSQKKAVTV
ncbi:MULTISPECIES: archaellin/type IV pilin N-terminal domain-containing protein [unclassified Haladaptatus]|uniref:archaellin/type IV pilin N-terminal domain-containing protein n=1 Tax=unclassified Haladaptatus TaxID=2622732 RepID=UPI00209BD1DC|nr:MULTISPECIES: archaellin/type IV pilin N-terminal domain-containing protein [unclassified Haladaptatus]MCO8246525.1 flagellin [Haladaptatus sp. AB643]MCO8254763.1 flagellin [Haladaptatus sp. AB618]